MHAASPSHTSSNWSSSRCLETKCSDPGLIISVSVFAHVYLCNVSVLTSLCFVLVEVFLVQDRCVSPALLFHSLQRRWVWLVQPFGLADVFSWPRNWGFGYLYFSFLSFLLFSSWHTRMPKAITVKYQPHLLDGSTTIAIVAAELQSDAPGFGSRAYPTQPTTSLRQTDALKMEECTQMGCCLSFRRP